MALTERRPIESLGMASPASPTFNPNTLSIASTNGRKNRTKSLPLHPTEKGNEENENENEKDDKELGEVVDGTGQTDNNEQAVKGDLILEEQDGGYENETQNHEEARKQHQAQDQDKAKIEEEHSPRTTVSSARKQSIATGLAKMGIDSEPSSSSSRSTTPESILDKGKNSTRESSPPTSTSSPPYSNDVANNSNNNNNNNTSNPLNNINSGNITSAKKVKKLKPVSRAPIATGISTAIPVTGEKPKPLQEGDDSLEDDVLYAIFVILFEHDPNGQGLTVKQICDVLTAEKPEMANLSTKTSNLVSAKLNAYIKRIEKGDTSLKYAISRDWADASPKRMVYVYRGILAPGYEHVAKKLVESLKKNDRGNNETSANGTNNVNGTIDESSQSPRGKPNPNAQLTSVDNDPLANSHISHADNDIDADSFEATKQASLAKPRRQTMFDLGITKHSFFESHGNFEKPNLNVPYSSAPVAAAALSLTPSPAAASASSSTSASATTSATTTTAATALSKNEQSANGVGEKRGDDDDEDEDDEDLDIEIDMDMDMDMGMPMDVIFSDDEDDAEEGEGSNSNRNGSSHMITTVRKNGKRSKSMSYLSVKKKFVTAAAAAPRFSSRAPSSLQQSPPHAAMAAAEMHAAALRGCCGSYGQDNSKWLDVVRLGFLTQDIGAPEDTDISLFF